MSFRLAPLVRLAVLGETAVWLKLSDDSYHCTPGAVFSWTDRGCLRFAEPAIAADLMEAGLIRPAVAGPGPQTMSPPPSADLAQTQFGSQAQRMPLSWWRRGVQRHYLGRAGSILALGRVVQRLTPLPAFASRSITLGDAVDQILRWQRWQPWTGACLPRSFQMASMLREAGLPCRWVFGVRAWPFAAHCWVESDGVALNDSSERLAAFQPIHCV